MADEKKDIFAEQTPAGLPAYPQVIYAETGETYPNGDKVLKTIGVAKNPEQHKQLLGHKDKKQDKKEEEKEEKQEPAWG